MSSYGLAVQLADEWESEVRERKKKQRKAVTFWVEERISIAAHRSGAPMTGTWNYRDVARKACQILRERLGEE